jgi:DNA-binding NtrC family response regulator
VSVSAPYPLKKPVMQSGEPLGGAQVTVLAVAPESERAALRRMLEHSRWTLMEASTIEEAAATLRQDLSIVLICEAELPDGSWVELLDYAQRLAAPPPVIVTSRQADDDLWMEVLNRGGYNVLGKPFSAREVFEMVSVAWRHRKHRVRVQAAG